MARMPGAQWVGPRHDNGTMSRYDTVCLHTIVGNPPAHAAHFSTRADGHIYQSRDTAYRSAANYNGNHRVIAIENDDHGPEFGTWNVNDGHSVPAFTAAQIEAIARICAWAYHAHGIPLVACPDSRPGSRGIAFHRQGINGNWAGYAYGGRVSGGEVWTKADGKVCPGDRRIAQIPQIIARARQLAGLDPSEDEMPLTAQDTNAVWMFPCTGVGPDGKAQTHPAIAWITAMAYRVAALTDAVAAIQAAQTAPAPVDIDYDRLADAVAARLGTLKFDAE
jgi:hypothetical protein